MPYGITFSAWARRFHNRTENLIVSATPCPYCKAVDGDRCITHSKKVVSELHAGRLTAFVDSRKSQGLTYDDH